MTLLSVRNLSVAIHEKPIVKDISFNLGAGEILALTGESGSGKSISALALMGLLPLGSKKGGIINFDGNDLNKISENKFCKLRGKKISMVFQEPMTALNPLKNIGRQISETLVQHKACAPHELKNRVRNTMDRVGLSGIDPSRFPHQLSGGQRQRVVIAMAVCLEPSILIADEPTTALDVTIQAQVINLIKDIIKEYQMGVIFITHDLGVIAQVADHVAVMYLGSVVEKGPVNEILKNPKHPYTKGLLQALPDINNLDAPLSPIPGNIPSPLDRPTGCVFRTRCPHHNPEGKDGKIEMKLIEVEPGHWVDQCGIKCGQNG